MSSIIHEKDYGFAIDILQRFIKSLKSMSDESLNAFFWRSCLFGIFIIKNIYSLV